MYLNIFLLVILLLGLIFVTDKIQNKGIIYFLLIILIFLCVKKFLIKQNEYFTNADEVSKQLLDSVAGADDTTVLNNRINELENTVMDLREVLKKQTIKNSMMKDGEAKTFSLVESQRNQDNSLESLEKELDILLRLYKKENESDNETKYKSLPVFSSCKVNDLGEMYKRDMSAEKEKRNEIVEALEKEELGKNLGIESETGRDLLSSVNKQINGNSGNVDININLD
tara:strand:- start:357 stop:1037 length:681 start_codon:yes stop_codon:yes gene_type:complete